MPRRLGLPSVYLAAAAATAAATAVPLAMTPASGLTVRPAVTEPTRPYVVVARGRAAARDLVGEVRWRVRRYYTAALPGFATFLTAGELAALRADPRVRAVEPDRQIHPMPVRPPARPLTGPATGAGTTIFLVDSGVDAQRAEFGDRAWRAFDATGGAGRDCTGHGTRIAGRAHAAAPAAGIASVRVLGCGGPGSLADLLAGLDWIRRHARGPSVAVLPVDGAGSPALGAAVRSLVRSGVFVVGAGDAGGCRIGPGGAAYTAAVPHLAAAAARRLEDTPGANPAILASLLNCTIARDAIRQNPSRALNLLMHSGGL
ncbi:S8 family serine peptidase [Actinomadura sp. ATCC 31491]|uniref:S8 family serine peptidase n=1 Tax=Actinomadura luzonensis TaxID=2805427 RepID=A0ABT0G0A9_9ACTN|nr:protease inhibitor I9 family protein [Actinomadura luzonensis]MCK2217573.1 S8 family serine peptidase [Actinomadura luzonensis]